MNFAQPIKKKFNYEETIRLFMNVASILISTTGWWFKPSNVLASLILILIVVIAKSVTDWQTLSISGDKGEGYLREVFDHVASLPNLQSKYKKILYTMRDKVLSLSPKISVIDKLILYKINSADIMTSLMVSIPITILKIAEDVETVLGKDIFDFSLTYLQVYKIHKPQLQANDRRSVAPRGIHNYLINIELPEFYVDVFNVLLGAGARGLAVIEEIKGYLPFLRLDLNIGLIEEEYKHGEMNVNIIRPV